MWRGVWLLYCLFIDRLLAVDSDMELREFKDISMTSGRRFSPFKLENTNDQDVRLDRTTTSIPHIALKDWMEKNPNLRKLAMFGIENELQSDLELELEMEEEEEEKKLLKAEDDNFHDMYTEVNRTLFSQTDTPDEETMAHIAMSTPRRRMPTGRALSDKTNPVERIPLNDLRQFPTTTESNPFEVTESLMRDLTQIGDIRVEMTPSPSPSTPPPSPSTLPPRSLPPFTPSTPRPPYYRIPHTIDLQRESISNRVEGEATLSFPPRGFVNSNVVLGSSLEDREDLPFIGDSTTFEQIPTAPPVSLNTHSIWTTPPPDIFTFTHSPLQRDEKSSLSSFRDSYFGTTEPSVDPPSLEQLHKGFEHEELVLFNSPDGRPMEGLNMNWSPLSTTTSTLLPRRDNKYHSGGMKRGEKKKMKKKKNKKRTKKIHTTDYSLSLNSQTATKFEMDEDVQLRLDLEKELKLLYNKDNEMKSKSRTKGVISHGVSKSWGRTGERKQPEIDKDPMFAMEREVVRTKKLREQIDGRPSIRKGKKILHKTYGRTSTAGGERPIAPLSQARMVSRGDRMIEQRVSMIGGQKVTVDLANPALHGADLMMNPGAVIHDLLDTRLKTDDRREIDGDVPTKWRGREQSNENETPTWNEIYDTQPHYKYIGEFADPNERVITDIDGSSRLEIETFDGSQFDRPSKCCDENEIEGHSKGQVESLDTLLIPLNSDTSRRTQTNSLYGQIDDPTSRRDSTDPERYVINNCFEEKRNCYLIDASPMERRIGLSSVECLRFCARVKGCLSVSFASTLSICDIYNVRNGTGTANLVQLLGYMYYEPTVTEVDKCMSVHSVRFKQKKIKNIRRTQAKKRLPHTTTPTIDPMIVVNAKRTALNLTMATRARCPPGEETLFVRSRGVRDDGGSNLDTVLNINEDDCIFSCISNLAGYYDIFDCVSAQYDSYNEACTLSSDPPKENSLSLHTFTNFYEKICTKSTVSSRCSGGTVERKRQKILTGLLRDSITVGSPLECIERCVDVNVSLSFKCMSVVYYYEESTFNCILNDGSSLTHPDSLFDENSSIVDYFGIDECHGIREISHRISENSNELHSFIHEGGLTHKMAERPLPSYEQARI